MKTRVIVPTLLWHMITLSQLALAIILIVEGSVQDEPLYTLAGASGLLVGISMLFRFFLLDYRDR